MKTKLFPDVTSFGASTMGKKGQVVIPAEIRKKLRIKAGEKLIVFLTPSPSGAVVFIPAEQFGKMVFEFDKKLVKLKRLTK